MRGLKKTNTRDANLEESVDRVTYSESVKVNIGDYESRDIFISVSTDVQKKETVDDAILRAKKIVQPQITRVEKRTRIQSKGNVDFDTMSKLRS